MLGISKNWNSECNYYANACVSSTKNHIVPYYALIYDTEGIFCESCISRLITLYERKLLSPTLSPSYWTLGWHKDLRNSLKWVLLVATVGSNFLILDVNTHLLAKVCLVTFFLYSYRKYNRVSCLCRQREFLLMGSTDKHITNTKNSKFYISIFALPIHSIFFGDMLKNARVNRNYF